MNIMEDLEKDSRRFYKSLYFNMSNTYASTVHINPNLNMFQMDKYSHIDPYIGNNLSNKLHNMMDQGSIHDNFNQDIRHIFYQLLSEIKGKSLRMNLHEELNLRYSFHSYQHFNIDYSFQDIQYKYFQFYPNKNHEDNISNNYL